MPEPSRLFRADWVLPVTADPIRDGAVRARAGAIAAMGPASSLPPEPGEAVIELPGAILLPALVNAHSHLELTAMEGLFPPGPFFPWIRSLVGLARRLAPEDSAVSARAGAIQAAAAGYGTVADHSPAGTVPAALREIGLRGIVFQEVFGIPEDDAGSALAGLEDSIRRLGAGDRVEIGVSPHSIYASSGKLVAGCAAIARREGIPFSMHADESGAEAEFLRAGSGPFAEMYEERGLPWSAPGTTAVRYLESLGVLDAPRAQLVHLVHAEDADLEILSAHGTGIAVCPRSSAFFGEPEPPLARATARGIACGLGTDSPASGGSLDPRHDLRRARRMLGIPEDDCTPEAALRLIRLVTLDAARSLGIADRVGSLEPGKAADLVAIRPDLDPDRTPSASHPHLLAASHIGLPWTVLTVVAGEVICERRMPEEEHWLFPRCGFDRGIAIREEARALRRDLESRIASF